MTEEIWGQGEVRGVTVKYRNEHEVFVSLSEQELEQYIATKTSSQFSIKKEDGTPCRKAEFPLTSGTIVVHEYNEAKIRANS